MKTLIHYIAVFITITLVSSCVNLKESVREAELIIPDTFGYVSDSIKSVNIPWRQFFDDEQLQLLIDTALVNNQELNIVFQTIELERNEVLSRQGEYFPSVVVGVGAGLEKPGQYTRDGAIEEQLTIKDGQEFPEPLGDFTVRARASWEVDIWRKLRNAKDAATYRYLASIEGKNFMVTQLVAEIAGTYYELLALDNLLQTVEENIIIQSNALQMVNLQKDAARATQLAVNRFEAQLLKTQNLQYDIKQKITEAENKLYFLTGSINTKIERSSNRFLALSMGSLEVGVPSQLLENRPDIRQAELEIAASKLDVKSAKASFYPSLDITAGMGFNTFNPAFLLSPHSLLYNVAGDLMAPIINRKGIKAAFNSANIRQLQAVIEYEQAILAGFVDVRNQLAKIENYTNSFRVKSNEVEILEQSVRIANSLYNSARADYVEVLLTQEEMLDAKLEIIEIKAKWLEAKVGLYRSLGGGWR